MADGRIPHFTFRSVGSSMLRLGVDVSHSPFEFDLGMNPDLARRMLRSAYHEFRDALCTEYRASWLYA